MALTPENTDYQEFLSLISGVKTIEKHTILINYEDEITGNLEQLNELSKEIEDLNFKKFIHDLNEKANKEISDIEVKRYLKELTDNFDVELTRTALFELEVFENMVFNEIVHEAAHRKYVTNCWEIPVLEAKDPKSKELDKVVNYKEMKSKVFPFLGWQLQTAKNYLQESMQVNQKRKLQPVTEERIKNLEAEYDILAEEYHKRFGHDIPFGAYIFKEIKKGIDIIPNKSERLLKYKENLHYWTESSLTNRYIIGETEVTDRLIPLLKNEISLLESIDNKESEQAQKEETEKPKAEKQEIAFEFLNNFDNVASKDVYSHFKKGLVKSKMLTENELQNFIIAAFQNQTVLNNKFKFKNFETKDKVMKVFYEYYKHIAGKPHGKQKKYAALLGNYFQGFKTSTVSSNFSKTLY